MSLTRSAKPPALWSPRKGSPRALLNDEEVRAIAVDGANRNGWATIGAIRSVARRAHRDPSIHRVEQSALFQSDQCTGLQWQSGRMWIGTEAGLLTYQTGNHCRWDVHASTVEVYPNPVRRIIASPLPSRGCPGMPT